MHVNQLAIKNKIVFRDVGQFIDEHLNWVEHVQNRIRKSVKCLFLLKRNTSCVLSMKSKVHLYRAIISPTLFFASECWELRKSEYEMVDKLHKRCLKWICGNNDYKKNIIESNLLPPLYFKVFKDLIFYRRIIEGHYNVDFTQWIRIKRSRRRIKVELPETRYEIQRQNFWYRTGYRVNIIQENFDFFNTLPLKEKLLEYMWDYFMRNWNENNPCSWNFICICECCRAKPLK